MIYLPDQVVKSDVGYPPEYEFPTKPEQMLKKLKKQHEIDISMGMDLLNQVQKQAIKSDPKWIEGYVPIFRQSILGDAYFKSLLSILEKVNQLYQDAYGKKLLNHIKGKIENNQIFSTEKNVVATTMLEQQQLQLQPETPIIWIPTQLGMRWRGKSVLHAHLNSAKAEFLFNTFQNSSLLLTIPERLPISDNILYMDCGGDRILSGDAFSMSPYLSTWYGDLGLGCVSADNAHSHYGAVSGLVRS